jgi:hypothetical protein
MGDLSAQARGGARRPWSSGRDRIRRRSRDGSAATGGRERASLERTVQLDRLGCVLRARRVETASRRHERRHRRACRRETSSREACERHARNRRRSSVKRDGRSASRRSKEASRAADFTLTTTSSEASAHADGDGRSHEYPLDPMRATACPNFLVAVIPSLDLGVAPLRA